jgi:O-antigen/teichoic acid export membrane protein
MLVTSLRLVNMATFPVLMLLPVLGSPLVAYVFGEPWRPGLLALGCFAFRFMIANVTSTLVGYLNATNRAGMGLRIALAWTVFEWGIGVPLALWQGFNGIAIAYALGVLLPAFWLLVAVKDEVAIPYGRVFAVPLAIGALAASLAWGLSPFITSLWVLLAVLGLSAGTAYALVGLLERDQLRELFASRRAGPAAPMPQEVP